MPKVGAEGRRDYRFLSLYTCVVFELSEQTYTIFAATTTTTKTIRLLTVLKRRQESGGEGGETAGAGPCLSSVGPLVDPGPAPSLGLLGRALGQQCQMSGWSRD